MKSCGELKYLSLVVNHTLQPISFQILGPMQQEARTSTLTKLDLDLENPLHRKAENNRKHKETDKPMDIPTPEFHLRVGIL